jgi:hypothetical protein
MFLQKVKTKKQLLQLAELVAQRCEHSDLNKAIEKINEYSKGYCHYKLAYTSLTHKPVGYLLITKFNGVLRMYVDISKRYMGHATKMLETLILKTNFKHCDLNHCNWKNSLAVIAKLKQDQPRKIIKYCGIVYSLPLFEMREQGSGIYIYRRNMKELFKELILAINNTGANATVLNKKYDIRII